MQLVRDRARIMAKSSRKDPSQLVFWTKVLAKTNLILKAVDKETKSELEKLQDEDGSEEGAVFNPELALPPIDANDATSPDYISYERFLTQLKGGAKNSHPHLENHTIEWKDGKVFCTCCNNARITYLKNMYRHTLMQSHKRNLEIRTKGKQREYITFERFITQLNGGARNSHKSIRNHP